MYEKNENAAQRKTYTGNIFDEGEKTRREEILAGIPKEWRALHRDGHIHIHDLDAYGYTYNCLTFDLLKNFPYKKFDGKNGLRAITGVFEHIKLLIAKVGNEQSGGMGFANFDTDLAEIMVRIGVEDNVANREVISSCLANLIRWCSESHERMGQVSYYVTLNIGLADSELSRFVCESLLDEFMNSPADTIRPNIVFKVKDGVNLNEKDPNHYLLIKATVCTSKKMIPTYLLCDCEMDVKFDPRKLSVMGCRTRVVDDLFGEPGGIGRGNIDNISINLPRLALEVDEEIENASVEEKIVRFKQKWMDIANIVKQILLDRYRKTLERTAADYPTVSNYQLWMEDFKADSDSENVFRHGTLSFGFIGLSEAIEILTGKRFYEDDETLETAEEFIAFMRNYADQCRNEHNLNFSLLATSGEQISGRFEKCDEARYKHAVMDKEFYTNSFHVNVDSGLGAFRKIEIEGKFHRYANGGCITYVEMNEAPIGNEAAMLELIVFAIKAGVHYLGFNFKLDVCGDCDSIGIFDVCPECSSGNVIHFRRVSGYLEDVSYFTHGKKGEEKIRTKNGGCC